MGHGSYNDVWHCFSHDPWGFVTITVPMTHGKKLLKGLQKVAKGQGGAASTQVTCGEPKGETLDKRERDWNNKLKKAGMHVIWVDSKVTICRGTRVGLRAQRKQAKQGTGWDESEVKLETKAQGQHCQGHSTQCSQCDECLFRGQNSPTSHCHQVDPVSQRTNWSNEGWVPLPNKTPSSPDIH